MSPFKKKQKEKRRKNLFRKWHRRVGFAASIFLFNLAITGILLNHSDDLSLHKQYIKSDWIVSLYGIKPPEKMTCIKSTEVNNRICQLGEIIFVDNAKLIENSPLLVGLVKLNEVYYLATVQKIFVYTTDFQLIETLDHETKIPTPITHISLAKSDDYERQSLIILSNQKQWSLDQNELTWHEFNAPTLSRPSQLDIRNASTNLQVVYLDNQITLLKFIQDLHSGRVLQLSGKLLTDLLGVILLLLAISGFIAWQKRKIKPV